jgi:uncharacterized protein YdeI (YjbR/CyaY-like superfamily)
MDLPTLERTSARAWRAWLDKQHAKSQGVWLVFHKAHTGKPSIPYLAALDEALCFGWIDSLIKRLDDDRYARKFTPRKATSKWSDINRRRWADLEAMGRLAAAGLAAAPTSKSTFAATVPILPAHIAKPRPTPRPRVSSGRLTPTERRRFVVWIIRKRGQTREKRLQESIAILAAPQAGSQVERPYDHSRDVAVTPGLVVTRILRLVGMHTNLGRRAGESFPVRTDGPPATETNRVDETELRDSLRPHDTRLADVVCVPHGVR